MSATHPGNFLLCPQKKSPPHYSTALRLNLLRQRSPPDSRVLQIRAKRKQNTHTYKRINTHTHTHTHTHTQTFFLNTRVPATCQHLGLTVACSKCTPIKLTWDANNLGSETGNSDKDEGFHEADENDGRESLESCEKPSSIWLS